MASQAEEKANGKDGLRGAAAADVAASPDEEAPRGAAGSSQRMRGSTESTSSKRALPTLVAVGATGSDQDDEREEREAQEAVAAAEEAMKDNDSDISRGLGALADDQKSEASVRSKHTTGSKKLGLHREGTGDSGTASAAARDTQITRDSKVSRRTVESEEFGLMSIDKMTDYMPPSLVEWCLLIYSIPYAVLSRVPFICFAMYMLNELDFTFQETARTMGLYCLGRLVGAHVAGMYPGSGTMFVGTGSGAVAGLMILLSKKQWVFVLATCLLGLTETVTGLETMLKIESLIIGRGSFETQLIFRAQFVFTCGGVLIAYIGGGFVYQFWGMKVICWAMIFHSLWGILMLAIVMPKRKVYRRTRADFGAIIESYQEERKQAIHSINVAEVAASFEARKLQRQGDDEEDGVGVAPIQSNVSQSSEKADKGQPLPERQASDEGLRARGSQGSQVDSQESANMKQKGSLDSANMKQKGSLDSSGQPRNKRTSWRKAALSSNMNGPIEPREGKRGSTLRASLQNAGPMRAFGVSDIPLAPRLDLRQQNRRGSNMEQSSSDGSGPAGMQQRGSDGSVEQRGSNGSDREGVFRAGARPGRGSLLGFLTSGFAQGAAGSTGSGRVSGSAGTVKLARRDSFGSQEDKIALGASMPMVTVCSIEEFQIIDMVAADSGGGDEAEGGSEDSLPKGLADDLFLGTVVAHFFWTTLGISAQFAIGALYWEVVWDVDAGMAGVLMGVGETLGVSLLMFLGMPCVFSSVLTRFWGKPIHVLNCCIGIGICCFMVTSPTKSMAACGAIGIHLLNVCQHSFQSELVGVCASGASFAKWISMSYVAKRLANAVCVFGSIIFFEIFGPQTSYRFIGAALVFWGTALYPVYWWIDILPCQLNSKEDAIDDLVDLTARISTSSKTLAGRVSLASGTTSKPLSDKGNGSAPLSGQAMSRSCTTDVSEGATKNSKGTRARVEDLDNQGFNRADVVTADEDADWNDEGKDFFSV